MYGILLHQKEYLKCVACKGEGAVTINGSLKTCRVCGGTGNIRVIDEIRKVLRRFQLPNEFTVSHSHSVLLAFRTYDVESVIRTAQALAVSGIKGRIVFPIA